MRLEDYFEHHRVALERMAEEGALIAFRRLEDGLNGRPLSGELLAKAVGGFAAWYAQQHAALQVEEFLEERRNHYLYVRNDNEDDPKLKAVADAHVTACRRLGEEFARQGRFGRSAAEIERALVRTVDRALRDAFGDG